MLEALQKADQSQFDAAFRKMAENVSNLMQKSVDKDEKVLILAGDIDSLAAAVVIYFLMKNCKMNYT